MFMWIIIGVCVLPMVVMAVFLLQGKGAFLISGYNMMSAEKKATYDVGALCRSVGCFLLVLSALMLLLPISLYSESMWFFYSIFILIMVISIGYAIYANTGNRFRKDIEPGTKFTREPMSRGKKAAVAAGVILSVWFCIGIGIMFYQGERDPVVFIHSDSIQISGMYGTVVPVSNISEISLTDKSMREIGIGVRTNGYDGGGQAKKGEFSSSEHGSLLLFVMADSSPTIRIDRNVGRTIFISFRNSETTQEVYSSMIAALPLG